MHAESTSLVVSETVHVQQEIDANYANVSQLSKVSMETKLQRFCQHTVILVRDAARRRMRSRGIV